MLILGELKQALIEKVASLPSDNKKYRIVAYDGDLYFNDGTQYVKITEQSSSPTFQNLSVYGNISVTGDVDGRDVSDDGSVLDAHVASASGHSDVVLNNTHRTGDGSDHANVALNDAHRLSASGHSDVALNNVHRTGDGSDHANVALNDAHRVSNGTDHSYIGQDVTKNGSPQFVGLLVGASGDSLDASAVCQVNSTTKGFSAPRMTTIQREAISSPMVGLLVFDTNEDAYYQYKSTGWAQVGSGGGVVTGDNQRLSAMDIDGTTNAIDTNKALYTVGAGDYIRGAKIAVCNRNGGYTAKVRIAHIDGAIGDIADEDYILYDDYLLPYETKIIELDGLIPTDTILVRSNITNVNFVATGEVLASDIGLGRVGAVEIDGTTNTVDTDYGVFTATEACKVNLLICNRNSGDPVECQVGVIDGAVGVIADADRLFFSLDNSQTSFIEGEFNLAVDETISFRSDTSDVNCIVYRVA